MLLTCFPHLLDNDGDAVSGLNTELVGLGIIPSKEPSIWLQSVVVAFSGLIAPLFLKAFQLIFISLFGHMGWLFHPFVTICEDVGLKWCPGLCITPALLTGQNSFREMSQIAWTGKLVGSFYLCQFEGVAGLCHDAGFVKLVWLCHVLFKPSLHTEDKMVT